jgi:OOP family OmpA-OmpF porin
MTLRIVILSFALSLLSFGTVVQAQTLEELKELQEEESKSKKEKEPKPEKTKEPKTKEEKVKEDDGKKATEEESSVSKKDKGETEEKSKVSAEPKPVQTIDPRAPKPYKSWSLTLMGGFTNPYTDIRYKDFFGTIEPKSEFREAVGISTTKMLSGAFGLMANFTYAKIVGVADTNMSSPTSVDFFQSRGLINDGLFFSTTAYQGSINLYWNISNTVFGINKRIKANQYNRPIRERKVSFYTYLGLGLNHANYNVRNLTTTALVDSTATGLSANSSSTEIVIPFGMGLKFKVSKLIDLGFEANWNFLLSDRLDGIEWDHPSRGKNDKFSNIGMTLTFKLGTKKKDKEHIEWINPLESVLTDFDDMSRKVDRLASDSDGDGVSDAFDKDSETPEGVKVDGSGQAMDVDYDGVADYQDEELFTDKGASVDESGKALDSDNDGVPDHKDRELNTPEGNFVNFQGMTIADHIDMVPDDWNKMRGFNFNSVFFALNSSVIPREYEDDLYNVARALKENEGMKMYIVGHTDQSGPEEYNIELGRRRAEAVIKYLVDNFGVDGSQMEAVTKGESEPVSESRATVNRRVDFIIE